MQARINLETLATDEFNYLINLIDEVKPICRLSQTSKTMHEMVHGDYHRSKALTFFKKISTPYKPSNSITLGSSFLKFLSYGAVPAHLLLAFSYIKFAAPFYREFDLQPLVDIMLVLTPLLGRAVPELLGVHDLNDLPAAFHGMSAALCTALYADTWESIIFSGVGGALGSALAPANACLDKFLQTSLIDPRIKAEREQHDANREAFKDMTTFSELRPFRR